MHNFYPKLFTVGKLFSPSHYGALRITFQRILCKIEKSLTFLFKGYIFGLMIMNQNKTENLLTYILCVLDKASFRVNLSILCFFFP